MLLITLLLFFIYTHGLGYSLTRFLKTRSLEILIMRIGIGMGTMPVLGLYLNALRIPLDWRIFLILANILPLYDLFHNCAKIKIPQRFRKPRPEIIILFIIFSIHLLIYLFGAFSYPWLEDTDPYEHAAGIKYIAIEKNVNVPTGVFHYINPYPPGYDIVFAILHQTLASLQTTLKFFNSLIVALSLLFFFYMVRDLSGNKFKALLGTFFLAIAPCYLTRFIWAQSLAIALFFPALYLLNKARLNKKYILPAVFVMAGIFLTQPTKSIKFAVLVLLIFLSLFLIERKWYRDYLWALIVAAAISLVWWLPVGLEILSGQSKLAAISGQAANMSDILPIFFNPTTGTSTTSYTIFDYIFIRPDNLINSPTGLGPPYFVLALGGAVLMFSALFYRGRKTKTYALIVLSWAFFTILGMNSMTFHLPIGLFAFRFWLLFAIPAALLAAECFYSFYKRFGKILAILILTVLLFTAGYSKFSMNIVTWYPGIHWYSKEELKGHVWLRKHLPPNTKVFAFCDNFLVLAFDMRADFWSPKYKQDLANAADLEINQFHKSLKDSGFEYVIVKEKDFKIFDSKKISYMLERMRETNLFSEISSVENSFWIFKIT